MNSTRVSLKKLAKYFRTATQLPWSPLLMPSSARETYSIQGLQAETPTTRLVSQKKLNPPIEALSRRVESTSNICRLLTSNRLVRPLFFLLLVAFSLEALVVLQRTVSKPISSSAIVASYRQTLTSTFVIRHKSDTLDIFKISDDVDTTAEKLKVEGGRNSSSVSSNRTAVVPTTTNDDRLVKNTLDMTASEFLYWYSIYCQVTFVQKRPSNLPLCPCIPKTLLGQLKVRADLVQRNLAEIERTHSNVIKGGQWQPTECLARQRVAIIVPFRDRESHLKIFLFVMHEVLKRQQLYYRIIVVEQESPEVFNKASLMNAGFKETLKLDEDFDCFIFHDVDMLVEDDRNFFTCSTMPRHVGSHLSKWGYKLFYEMLVGGATAFTQDHFEMVNGFSNQYYGWGGEDDDMYFRIRARKMNVIRYSGDIARYSMLSHAPDKRNPENKFRKVTMSQFHPEVFWRDGLSNLLYTRLAIEYRHLYTWILIALPPAAPAFAP